MDISIIIVSWNVKDKLEENLRSLFASIKEHRFSAEVFVVDNASADGSADMVAGAFPSVVLMANKENLGFAKANNLALRRAQGDYVLLLNPDMRVNSDTLKNMIAWMGANPQAAVAGCKLVSPEGELVRHVRRFPKISDQMAIILKLPHLIPGVLKSYLMDGFDYEQAAKVDSIRGGFFMIRRETLERIGFLDERYFVWFEEVDYCRRVSDKRHGGFAGQVWYTPAARCIDHVGQSFKQIKRGQAQEYFRDSMLKYFKKWHPYWQFVLLSIVWPLGSWLVKAGETMKIRPKAKT